LAQNSPETIEQVIEPDEVLASEAITQISITKRVAAFVASFAIFLILWQIVASAAGNPAIVVGPLPVFQALIALLQNNIPPIAQGAQTALSAIAETLEVIAIGFALSLAVGIPIGIISGLSRFAGSISDPWIELVNSVPIVVLVPIIYYSIGTSFTADILIAFLFSVFSVILNTQNGVRYVSNSLAEVGRTFGASNWQFVAKIVLPASAPDIETGMKIALGRVILGAVLAEALLAQTGLGGMMMNFQATFLTNFMMATIVLLAIMGILVLQAPKILEKQLFRWKDTERMARGT
jgi:ABC-type nitrate/sulfonate/bicarbonate transport system permease component